MSEVISKDALNAIEDVDTLLNLDMEEIEDVKEFTPLPVGGYNFEIYETGLTEINDNQAIQIKMKVLEVIELAQETEEDPEDLVGRTLIQSYLLGGKRNFMLQQFKTTFKSVAEELGCATIRELIEGLSGYSITGIVKHRKVKNKETGDVRVYEQLDPYTCFPLDA